VGLFILDSRLLSSVRCHLHGAAMATNPDTVSDPKLLRNLMQNADKAGMHDLVLKCQIRIAQLAGQKFDDKLEREFWIAVTTAEELATQKNGRTTRLARTRQKAKRVGAIQCLVDWASDPQTTQGFAILINGGHAELTGEAIVVRHADNFPTRQSNRQLKNCEEQASILRNSNKPLFLRPLDVAAVCRHHHDACAGHDVGGDERTHAVREDRRLVGRRCGLALHRGLRLHDLEHHLLR